MVKDGALPWMTGCCRSFCRGAGGRALWFVVFGILGLVILGGGFLAFEAADADETALYGFVGTALGAIVGVLVPSPSMPSTSKK